MSKFVKGPVPDRAPNSTDAPQPPTSLRAITAGLAERRPLMLLAMIRDAVKDPSTPLNDDDRALLARFEKHLDKALTEFESSQADQTTAAAMTRGLHDARRLIDERVRTSKRGDNGWVTIKAGEWGNKYLDRAAIADYAIYANRAASSMYPEIHGDEIGEPLVGSQRYTLRFEKGQLPPASDCPDRVSSEAEADSLVDVAEVLLEGSEVAFERDVSARPREVLHLAIHGVDTLTRTAEGIAEVVTVGNRGCQQHNAVHTIGGELIGGLQNHVCPRTMADEVDLFAWMGRAIADDAIGQAPGSANLGVIVAVVFCGIDLLAPAQRVGCQRKAKVADDFSAILGQRGRVP
jgi:hypothetical protein